MRGAGAAPLACSAVTAFVVVVCLLACSTSTALGSASGSEEVAPLSGNDYAQSSGHANGAAAQEVESGLVWVVLTDLSRTRMTADSLLEAMKAFLTNSSATHKHLTTLLRPSPIILDTGGNVLTALRQITDLLEKPLNFPSILFLADTADVSTSVVDVLRQDVKTSDILVISVHSSNIRLCDPSTNLRTMCMVPLDMMNVRGLLEVASKQLSWHSMSLVFSNNGYGDGVRSTITAQVQSASTTPTIVAQTFMNSALSTANDDAVIESLTEHYARGVGCFLREAEMRRLHEAMERNTRAAKRLFLIGSRESLNILPALTGDVSTAEKPWGALFVSAYTSPVDLVQQGFFPISAGTAVDDYSAFVLSHLLDGLLMLDAAKGTIDNMDTLRATRFAGYTGNVAFDSVYFQRVEVVFSLITAQYPVQRPLVTWSLKNYSSVAPQVNRNPEVTAALVTASPLRAAKICMTSPPSCASVSNLMTMLFVLLMYNRKVANSSGDNVFNFYPVALSVGTSGVTGLASLIPMARTCTVLSGPGSDAVVMAFNPVVNEFQIPQLDYGVSNDYFTDNPFVFPFFSRSLPKNTFADGAVAEICTHYGWERVIIITSKDQFAASHARSMERTMQQQNLYVEMTYHLPNSDNATLADCMNDIYAKRVSRVIIVTSSFTDNQAKNFFTLSDHLTYMRQYIFFLGTTLCSIAEVPEKGEALRQKLPSSFCIYPYISHSRFTEMNTLYKSSEYATTRQEMRKLISDGGFLSSVESCDMSSISPYTGFAADAGYVLIDAVSRAFAANVTLNVASRLLPFIRNTSIDKFTTNCTINSSGNRLYAIYSIDIQLWNGDALFIGTWNPKALPTLDITNSSFVWLTNRTSTPLDTFRDASFVLGSAFSASTGTIVVSILGFILTIAVFCFCYRHYRMQKMVEQALEANQFPVTDEELRRLRGIKDDV